MRTGLVARSRAMRALLDELARFAAADANVLIAGETGAGKDMVARALHLTGPRRGEPFVQIDCPSLPATLLESELFGHERGAFTDATTARPGRFEVAGRGTVYLDRVNELPLEIQPKLLRLVEEKRGERLGSNVVFDVRARVIASTDTGIEERVRSGSFRRDLYHRLNVLPLVVPPLRDRRSDILPLARTFLREAAARAGRAVPVLTRGAAAALQAHGWPGNVRELRHVLDRAVLSTDRNRIDVADLPLEVLDPQACIDPRQASRPTLDGIERQYIEFVLREVRGRQTRAAAILGISRKALWEKRKRYGLE
jgi:DNA-binding NtrC family response regulator